MKFRVKRPGPAPAAGIAAGAGDDGPISSRRKSGRLTPAGRWVLGLFFSVFLLVGLGVTYALAVEPWVNVWRARSWTPVACEIISSEVRSHRGDSTTYSVAIAYVYETGGREYTGGRYDFTKGSSSGRKKKAAIVARNRPGKRAVCYVNPENPAESVLERGVRDWAFGLIPLVFVVIGGGGVLFAIFGQRKRLEPRGGAGALHGEKHWTRAAAATGTVDHAHDATMRDGAVELAPGSTRVGKLVGISLFALFWNGIVSIFVVNVGRGIMRGGVFEWVFVLFLLPFVGVGIFLIGLAVRFAMELANPVPHLTVNRRAFAPGEMLELSWRFAGRAKRLTAVRFWLEGREEATYRRGTDTRTDKEVFATLEIASVSGLAAAEAGHASLRLPGRMMHSFKSGNNRVVWELRVKGEIARWPDLSEEFPVTIVPGSSHAPDSNVVKL